MAADLSQHAKMKSAFVDPLRFTFREEKSFTLVNLEFRAGLSAQACSAQPSVRD